MHAWAFARSQLNGRQHFTAAECRLLLFHDPDAVPVFGRRVVGVLAAAVDEDARGLVAGRYFERVGKMPDRAAPVAALVAIEPGLVGGDQRRQPGKPVRFAMVERLVGEGWLASPQLPAGGE